MMMKMLKVVCISVVCCVVMLVLMSMGIWCIIIVVLMMFSSVKMLMSSLKEWLWIVMWKFIFGMFCVCFFWGLVFGFLWMKKNVSGSVNVINVVSFRKLVC